MSKATGYISVNRFRLPGEIQSLGTLASHIFFTATHNIQKGLNVNVKSSFRLDYCNSPYSRLLAYQTAKIQRVQYAAARVIYRVPRYSHVSPLLAQPRWLPV